MKYTYRFIFLYLALTSSLGLFAQTNDADVYVKLVPGTTFFDTVYSRFKPGFFAPDLNFSGEVIDTPIAPNTYQVKIELLVSSFLGDGKIFLSYTEGNGIPKPKYSTYHINSVISNITAKPDFISIGSNSTITFNPLGNDVSTAPGLKLDGIGQVQYGSATFVNDSITYTSNDDADLDYLVYSVSDSLGSKASSLVYLLKEQPNANDIDTFRYTLNNTNHQFIILPYTGFTLSPSNGVDKGVLVQKHDLVFDYIPNKGSSGTDNFLLETSSGKKRLVIIKLINKIQNSTSVRDDKFYTPKNTPITFDVFANDLSKNFPITAWSPGLVHDTLGLFSYTPPINFSGEKNFTYTVYYGAGYSSVGKIKIIIGNFKPQQTFDYKFKTDKNTPLVLEYDMPINGYSFELVDDPSFGTFEPFYDTSIDIDCNTIKSKVYIVYTPDPGYYGADSLSISYKVINNDSVIYKLYIDILDSTQDSLCKCVGADCVWQGDMNGDGRVSVVDLLSLGRYIGLKGDARDDLEYPYWAGQNGENWIYSQPNGVNTKHIDADGDGIISAIDSSAIANNYGGIHNLVPDEILGIKDYAFTLVPNAESLDSGDLLILDILIGTNSAPVVDVFGLAFGLNFSPSLIDSASLSGHFDADGWFGRTSPTLQMMKQPQEGKIHMAFTRTGSIVDDEVEGFKPTGVSGNGKIGQISFIVDDEVEGFKTGNSFITRRINTDNITIELSDGGRYFIPDTYVDIKINLNKSTPTPSDDKLLVFPNPARQSVNLHFNGRNIINAYKMVDLYGNVVSQLSVINDNSVSINTSSYPSGTYVLQVVTSQGVITKKVEILK